MTTDRPLVLLDPAPQTRDRIFAPATWQRLRDRFEVVDFEERPDPARFDELLPRAFAVVGQPDLPAERLRRATALRALINVEGNFFPNVDYPTAFAQGVRVLGCGPAYSSTLPVSGITRDRHFDTDSSRPGTGRKGRGPG